MRTLDTAINPFAFINKPNRKHRGHDQHSQKRNTPAQFEPGQCQNCGGIIDDFKRECTFAGMPLIVYFRKCTNPKCPGKQVTDHYGSRWLDPDIERSQEKIRRR